jgi:hypothetical protein
MDMDEVSPELVAPFCNVSQIGFHISSQDYEGMGFTWVTVLPGNGESGIQAWTGNAQMLGAVADISAYPHLRACLYEAVHILLGNGSRPNEPITQGIAVQEEC